MINLNKILNIKYYTTLGSAIIKRYIHVCEYIKIVDTTTHNI